MLICLVSYLVCDTFHICLQVTYQVFIYLQLYLEPYGRSNMGMYLLICRSEGAGLFVCLEWYLAFYRQLSVQISLLIVLLKILPGAFFLPPPPLPFTPSSHFLLLLCYVAKFICHSLFGTWGINFGGILLYKIDVH